MRTICFRAGCPFLFFYMAAKLTIKQDKACIKYLECGDKTAAYRYAYNCSKMSDATVWNNAYKLFQNNEVITRIEYLKNHLAEAAGLSALKIVNEHKKIAFSDATRIRSGWMDLKDFEELTDEEKACIQTVETKTTIRKDPNGNNIEDVFVRVKLYDKQKALDSLTQILGFNAPIKNEHTGEGGAPIKIDCKALSDEDLKQAIQLIQKSQNGPGK